MILCSGDVGPVRATKIAGIPWWPRGIPRPCCSREHKMAFCAQILLSDVPSLSTFGGALLSFHYCQECSLDGEMSFGNCSDANPRGCDVSIFERIDQSRPDELGAVTMPLIDPYSVSLEDCLEQPTFFDADDWPEDAVAELPEPAMEISGEKRVAEPNVEDCKIGGWPSWVQDLEYPPLDATDRLYFVAQLGYGTCERAPWGGGGFAYLFARLSDTAPPVGFAVIQDS
jgi:uncharacterized protein YwqG